MGTRLTVPASRSLVLIHQLARELWFFEAPWPVALPGWLLEPVWLWLHRHRHAVTVSDSTARDLRRFGFRGVSVVPVSVELPAPPRDRRPPDPPLFVALGRLVRMKRFEHALRAFELFRAECPDARLVLMGRGDTPYARRLAACAERIPGVRVLRDASESDKARLLAMATALVATSVREGWGIMVTEAHAWGTPTLAYHVPGLRDSTHDGRDGLLTLPRPDALAAAMRRVASDAALWQALSRGARADAERHGDRDLEAGFAEVVERCMACGRG
jgi:glycosyltransferase involved in cell wall biosynthesis